MKVSFIIPVYNVAKYLHQCVRSILEQSYQDIEVILVDDGSKDESPAICDSFAVNDNRVKVIHKENGGLSDARNAGLKAATGEYVVFIDGDDFWRHNDDLQKLVDIVNKNPDLDFVGFNCSYYYPESGKFSQWVAYANEMSQPVNGDYATKTLVASGTFPMSACLKIIKRKSLVDNAIYFRKGQIHEDIPWFINLLNHTKKCIFVNEYIYAYRQNVVGSITNTISERSFYSLLDIVETELARIDTYTFSAYSKDSLKSFLAYELSILMMEVHQLPKDVKNAARLKLEKLTWLFSYTHNPKVRLVSILYKYAGLGVTEKMLRLYNWYRLRKS